MAGKRGGTDPGCRRCCRTAAVCICRRRCRVREYGCPSPTTRDSTLRAALQPLTEASDSVAQGKELEERCQQLRAAAAEREYESLTADCSRRERDAAAAEPFSSYKEALGLGACTPLCHHTRLMPLPRGQRL